MMRTRMTNVLSAVVLAACAVGGFTVGRMHAHVASEPSADTRLEATAETSVELAKLKKHVAELKSLLAEERARTKRMEGAARRAEKAVADAIDTKTAESGTDGMAAFTISTNADLVAEMKKQLPKDAFIAATNALSGLRAKLAERTKGRMEYLSAVDVSRMGKAERDNHARFLKLLERRETAMAKMKGGIPDVKTLEEMVALELEMRPVAKAERSALVREVARELGYVGDDVEVLHDTLDAVFDCTGSGGMDGIMEATDGQPGISIKTQVIGL